MRASEILREEVRHYIENANDKTLRIIKVVLEIMQEEDINEHDLEEEAWDDLPKELQVLIDEAIKEGEEGKVISYEQFKKKHSEWFRK